MALALQLNRSERSTAAVSTSLLAVGALVVLFATLPTVVTRVNGQTLALVALYAGGQMLAISPARGRRLDAGQVIALFMVLRGDYREALVATGLAYGLGYGLGSNWTDGLLHAARGMLTVLVATLAFALGQMGGGLEAGAGAYVLAAAGFSAGASQLSALRWRRVLPDLLATAAVTPLAVVAFRIDQVVDFTGAAAVLLLIGGMLLTFRLYSDVDLSRGRLEQLEEASSRLSASLDPAATVTAIQEGLSCLVSYDACQVLLPDQRGILQPAGGARPFPAPLSDEEVQALGAAPTAETRALAGSSPESAVQLLAAPLRAEGEPSGLILAARRGARFSADEVQIAAVFAAQAGLAVHNALLYAKERRLQQEKDEFLAIVSHEMRNPLTAIQGFARLALGQPGQEEEPTSPRHALGIIEGQASRLMALVEDLLDLARIEEGRLQLVVETVDLVALARDLSERQQVTAERHRFTVRARQPAVAATCDRRRTEQVLLNLLANAVKYSPSGGEIQIVVDRRGPEAQVRVRDHGIGISPDELPHIFERFFRAAGAARGAPGEGLGLYIVQRLIEAQQGRIWAESKPGQGSTFAFCLPTAGGLSGETTT